MPRFTHMLAEGMRNYGDKVEVWSPRPLFVSLPFPRKLKKWLGYVDQYIVFPNQVKKRLKRCEQNTLFVFTDNALGPWVPLVQNKPHVIHCHDFLAQYSALDKIEENPTGWTGKQYQKFIRRGYSKGKHFISVSHKTKEHLHCLLRAAPSDSEVVYNGLNQAFKPTDKTEARQLMKEVTGIDCSRGYLFHIGGNQWYKNRTGVVEIYNAWRLMNKGKLPLLLIGEAPDDALKNRIQDSPFFEDIHCLRGVGDATVRNAYCGATVFLFPSLAEGFGWPIAEAMASGCPVVTTNEPPMTEVAGGAAFLIPRRPRNNTEAAAWATTAAGVVHQLVSLSDKERDRITAAGLNNVKRFDAQTALRQIRAIYQSILSN